MPAAADFWVVRVLPPRERRWQRWCRPKPRLRRERRGSIIRPTALPISPISKPNEPFTVAYPDADAPGVLLKLGKRVPGGVGADGDIVGFSTTCPHKGFPLNYNGADKTMNCPGHYSRFDCESGGQQVWGQATQNLPQYALRVDDKGDIYAEGVDELLYGRLSNVL